MGVSSNNWAVLSSGGTSDQGRHKFSFELKRAIQSEARQDIPSTSQCQHPNALTVSKRPVPAQTWTVLSRQFIWSHPEVVRHATPLPS